MQNAFVKKRIGAVIGTLTFLVLIALIQTLTENNMTVMNCLPVLTM